MSSSYLSKFLGRLAGRREEGPSSETDEPAPASAADSPAPPADADASTATTADSAVPEPTGPESIDPGIATGHRLLRPIGTGAYGEVWLGQDELGNFHAVKLVRRDRFADKSPFEREYRGLLQYTPISRTHHGLVHILNVGRDNAAGLFFYVMELADCVRCGRGFQPDQYLPHTLERALADRGHLTLPETLALGIELCEALSYLHSKQLIHRDIKPPNIVFVNGLAKLADVGLVTHIAEARRDPKHLGTEGFIPPEGPGTPLADVYSLGKVLTESVFGTTALPAPDDIPDPALARFAAIMARACHDAAEHRTPSPAAVQTDLMELGELLG